MHHTEPVNTLPRVAYPGMSTEYNLTVYKEAKKELKFFSGSKNLWVQNIGGYAALFMGIVQLFAYKKAKMLKFTALVTYPLHAITLNLSQRKRQLVDI